MKRLIALLYALAASVAAFFRTRSDGYLVRRDPCAGADVYSTEYANAYNSTPPVKNSAAQLGGRIRIFRTTYTQGASAGNIGDVIHFGKLPAGGTRIPGGKCFFSTGAASSTLKIGVTGADADMCAATAITTAGSIALDVFAASGAVSRLTAETEIIGTVAGAGLAAGQKITVWQPYVMDD